MILTQTALTKLEVLSAFADVDILETEAPAQVQLKRCDDLNHECFNLQISMSVLIA